MEADHSARLPRPRPVYDAAGVTPLRLAVFCTVVECRGFTRAAEQLFLTRPAVSMHVHALEAALGAPLFDRRQRGARLTEAGQAVYEFAIGLHRDLADLRARLADLARGQAGAVTLGTVQTLGTYLLPELLARFQRAHPGSELRLRVRTSPAVAEEVERGRFDLGIVNEQTAIEAGLPAEPLWTEPMVLAARPDHPLARRARVTVADLAGEAFILGPGRTVGDRTLDAGLARRAARAPLDHGGGHARGGEAGGARGRRARRAVPARGGARAGQWRAGGAAPGRAAGRRALIAALREAAAVSR